MKCVFHFGSFIFFNFLKITRKKEKKKEKKKGKERNNNNNKEKDKLVKTTFAKKSSFVLLFVE
jgi:hypothetical protein